LTEFEIVIAIPCERKSRPAPQAPIALRLSMPDQHRFEIGDWSFGQRAKPASGSSRLLEGSRNGAEGVLQIGTEALDDGDDRNRDAGGDETIFDGGRSRFVLEK
jgi:hypothetical protein